MNDKEYIETRLDDQIDWHNRKSMYNQKIFKRFRKIEIVLAALIPLLSGAALLTDCADDLETVLIGAIGVAITILTGFLALGKQQELWIKYRTTCESLIKEKFLYETKAKPYHQKNAFPLLVERVESLLSIENTNWMQLISTNQENEGQGE